MPRWTFQDASGTPALLPTEFNHYEGALARTLGLPTLVRSSAVTAASIKRYLESLGAKVLDWQTDFIPGRTILEQISDAAAHSVGGIFLFTRDDDMVEPGQRETAAPRDNVVFEAGYFIGLKGKRMRLIWKAKLHVYWGASG